MLGLGRVAVYRLLREGIIRTIRVGKKYIIPKQSIIDFISTGESFFRKDYRIRGNSGEPLSLPPYGYIKSPDNPKKWIVDPEAAAIVKDIFKMCLEGKMKTIKLIRG